MSGGVALRSWGSRLAFGAGPPLLSPLRISRPAFLITRQGRLRTFCASSEKRKNKVVVISGPTGAGKSRLALELAKRLDGEIISADSVQVYRGLDIGSAKPSMSDRNEVPHHLLDILHPSEEYSVGQFFEDARKATEDILENGRVPIVVGGTGLYLRWYIYGKPDVPKASREITSEVYSELMHLQNTKQWDAAVELVVKAGDPKARSLASNDWYRLRRSLEIIKSSGSPPSAFSVPYDNFKEQLDSGFPDQRSDVFDTRDGLEDTVLEDLDYNFICFFLSIPRVELYRLIDFRCEEMLMGSPGILSEATSLLDTGLLPNSNSATRAIGYRQAMEYLLHCRQIGGGCSPGDFIDFLSEFQKTSRNFAKRQLTWFRNELIYKWLDASKPLEEVLNFIYDSYHDTSGNLMVPDFLTMKKDISRHRETYELKSYRPQNSLFVRPEDCFHILDWIRKTQLQ